MPARAEDVRQPPAPDDPYVIVTAIVQPFDKPKSGSRPWLIVPIAFHTLLGSVHSSVLLKQGDADQFVPEPGDICNILYYKDALGKADRPLNGQPYVDFLADRFLCYRRGEPPTMPSYETQTLSEVVITGYGEMPADSGMLHTRRQITVRSEETLLDVYVTWGYDGQPMPPIGSVCDIKWHWDWVDGYGFPYEVENRANREMESFSCKPGP